MSRQQTPDIMANLMNGNNVSLIDVEQENHKAIMFFKNGIHFWFHLRTSEATKIFDIQT